MGDRSSNSSLRILVAFLLRFGTNWIFMEVILEYHPARWQVETGVWVLPLPTVFSSLRFFSTWFEGRNVKRRTLRYAAGRRLCLTRAPLPVIDFRKGSIPSTMSKRRCAATAKVLPPTVASWRWPMRSRKTFAILPPQQRRLAKRDQQMSAVGCTIDSAHEAKKEILVYSESVRW